MMKINPKFEIRNPQLRKAITLLELLIAISLLAMIILAGSGIYLSGWNMFKDAQKRAQAQRNAIVPMAYITKMIQRGTRIAGAGGNLSYLTFNIDDNNTPGSLADDNLVNYNYSNATNIITCTNAGSTEFFARYIRACNFNYSNTSPFINISINATDTSNQSSYILQSRAKLGYWSNI